MNVIWLPKANTRYRKILAYGKETKRNHILQAKHIE